MAVKSFAIPLDENSKQTGDITIKALANDGNDVTFKLTFVTAAVADELDLITSKNGQTNDHKFSVSVSGGSAQSSVSASEIDDIYSDANGGDWDYVEAKWTMGSVDVGGSSNNYEVQSGQTYNGNGWPPAH